VVEMLGNRYSSYVCRCIEILLSPDEEKRLEYRSIKILQPKKFISGDPYVYQKMQEQKDLS
jgi:hypothetical protein